jgi:hypothetical protein
MQIKGVPATPALSKYARESAGARSQMTLSQTRDKMLVRTLDDLQGIRTVCELIQDNFGSYFETILNLYCERFGLNSKNSGRSLVA